MSRMEEKELLEREKDVVSVDDMLDGDELSCFVLCSGLALLWWCFAAFAAFPMLVVMDTPSFRFAAPPAEVLWYMREGVDWMSDSRGLRFARVFMGRVDEGWVILWHLLVL